MAKNIVLPGNDPSLEVAVPSGALSGEPVLAQGAIPGILETDEGGGVGNVAGRATVAFPLVAELSTTDAVAAENTALYITAARAITTTASGNTLFGRSIHMPNPVTRSGGTKSAGAGTVFVRLVKA